MQHDHGILRDDDRLLAGLRRASRSLASVSRTLGVLALAGPAAQAQLTTRVAGDSDGASEPVDHLVVRHALSPDGRWLVFDRCEGSTPGQAGNCVRLRDLQRGETYVASRSLTGEVAIGFWPTVSDDGRLVAFQSTADDLVVGDTNQTTDVFVYDRELDTVIRVSVDSYGAQNFAGSGWATISGDGSTVAFWCFDSSLVPNDTNYDFDVFVHGIESGETTRVSVDSNGQQSYNPCGNPFCPGPWGLDISRDGMVVTFSSAQNSLVPGDTNGSPDVFAHDRATATTSMISLGAGGAVAGGWCVMPAVSGDGRYVSFDTGTALMPQDTNNSSDVYLYDRWTGTIAFGSVGVTGAAGGGAYSSALSANGRYLGFLSTANSYVPGDTNSTSVSDVFVRDLITGVNRRASLGVGGLQMPSGTSIGEWLTITDDGRALFYADGNNFVVGDEPAPTTTSLYDVLLHDPNAPANAVLGYCTAKTNSLNCVPAVTVCGIPTLSPGLLFSVIAQHVRSQEPGIFFWGLTPQSTPFRGGTMCVAPPFHRTRVESAGGSLAPDCTGHYAFRVTPPFLLANNLSAGTTVYGQFWSHDPGFAPPNNVGLTDAVQFTVLP